MTEPANGTLGYRVTQTERRLDRLEAFEPAVLIQRIGELDKDITALTSRVQSLQARVLGLSLSIASGAVVIALTQVGVFH